MALREQCLCRISGFVGSMPYSEGPGAIGGCRAFPVCIRARAFTESAGAGMWIHETRLVRASTDSSGNP